MANLNKPTKFARKYSVHEGEIGVEKEHKDSCDINLMLKANQRGQMVRGGGSLQYGEDDMNMSGLDFRIQKQQLEENLANGPKEFTKEQLDLIPKEIQTKFGLRLKKEAPKPKAPNDDKTTKQPKKEQKEQNKPELEPESENRNGDS